MKTLTIFSFCTLLFHYSIAQNPANVVLSKVPTDNNLKNSIDSIVDTFAQVFMTTGHTIGLSIGIYKDGKDLNYNYGELNKGHQSLPSGNTIYPVASISKTFTSILLAQAVSEKKMQLTDDIRKYLKGSYPNLEYNGCPIKLMYLTNHRSGLPFLLPENPEVLPGFNNEIVPWSTRIEQLYKYYTRQDFYNDLHNVRLDTVPGYNFKYSNTAVQLLSYFLEISYNKPFEHILKQKITDPLHMANTKINIGKQDRNNLAIGYDDKGNIIPYTPDVLIGAGSIKSSVNDMLKYIKWNLSETNEAVRLSHQTIWGDSTSYSTGLNWQKLQSGSNTVIWQEGNIPGFNSYCVFYPKLNMGMVVLTNESDMSSSGRLTIMINRIMKAINSKAVALP